MEIAERVLSPMQRKQRGNKLRSRQKKIQQQRHRKQHMMADSKSLGRRALRMARTMVRERVAGKGKGKGYSRLPVTQKIVIDTMINKYGARIKKLAKMLLPFIHRGEMKRLQRVTSHGKGTVNLTGGVGRLNSDFQQDSHLIEDVNDYRLDKILTAGLKDKKNLQLYKRLLGDSTNYAKIEKHRTKLLSMLEKLIELITNDYQLYTRTEMLIKKNKLEENVVSDYSATINTIKRVLTGADMLSELNIISTGIGPIRKPLVPRTNRKRGKPGLRGTPKRLNSRSIHGKTISSTTGAIRQGARLSREARKDTRLRRSELKNRSKARRSIVKV